MSESRHPRNASEVVGQGVIQALQRRLDLVDPRLRADEPIAWADVVGGFLVDELEGELILDAQPLVRFTRISSC